ncbi:DUF4083 family protein [Sutcliffiella rhizosphaerae]
MNVMRFPLLVIGLIIIFVISLTMFILRLSQNASKRNIQLREIDNKMD